LRLEDLGGPSLWYDEIFHIQKAEAALTEPWYAWLTGLEVDRENGPLYYTTQLLALRISPDEIGARLIPALAGIVTVGLLFAVALAATRDRRVALVAAAFMALSPLHVYYSREARPYAAVMLAATLLLGLLVAEPRRWTLPAVWATCIGTAYLGAVSAPVLLSFTAISILAWIGGRAIHHSWARRFSIAGICGLGIGIVLFSSVEQISRPSAPSEMIVTKPLSAVALDRMAGSLTVSGVEWASADLRSFLMLISAAAGVWALARADRWRALATTGMCILPIASWLTLLVILNRWYNVRYTSAGLPALLILVAAGLVGCIDILWLRLSRIQWLRRHPWIPSLAILALAAVLVAPNWRTTRTEAMMKPDWRGLAELVGSLAAENEPVVTFGWWAESCLRHYLIRGGYETEVISSGRNLDKAHRLTADGRPAWLAAAGYVRGDEFRRWMRSTKPMVRSSLGNLELYFHPDLNAFLNEPGRTDGLIRLLERQGESPRRQEFEASQIMLGTGWSYPETAGDGTTFRWASAQSVELGLLGSARDYSSIKMRVLPFPSPDMPAQRIEVRLNSQHLGDLALDPGWNEYTLQIPPDSLQPGANLVNLLFAWQQAPTDLDPNATDQRRLAAAFDFVELIE
jgi:hypothetical protein